MAWAYPDEESIGVTTRHRIPSIGVVRAMVERNKRGQWDWEWIKSWILGERW
jgi:hypothetical protein